jgi:hypothetical protein
MTDPARHLIEQAAHAAQNGDVQPQIPPLQLELQNSNIQVADATDAATGAKMKLLVITHMTGGLRVVIPMPAANARLIGNALCDRPNVVLP